MIKKLFRLQERQIKKVLRFGKPFFSYDCIAKVIPNQLPYPRFWIILSRKCMRHAVTRNFFRRRFYNTCSVFVSLSQEKIFPTKKKCLTHIVELAGKPQIYDTSGLKKHFQFDIDTWKKQKNNQNNYDIIFIPKKGQLFYHKIQEDIEKFEKNSMFLLKKILEPKKNHARHFSTQSSYRKNR